MESEHIRHIADVVFNLNVQAATGDSSQEEAGSQEDTGGGASGRVTRSRTRPGGKTDKSQDAKVAGGQKGRGRKRKADTEGYKLSDYMDNQVSECVCLQSTVSTCGKAACTCM